MAFGQYVNPGFILNAAAPVAEGLRGWWPVVAGAGLVDMTQHCEYPVLGSSVKAKPFAGSLSLKASQTQGYALSFPGTADTTNLVNLGSTLAVNQFGPMTFMAWVYFTALPGNVQTAVIGGNASAGGSKNWRLGVTTTAGVTHITMVWGGTVIVTGATSLVTNRALLVGMTRSGATGAWTGRTDLNGISDGSASTATNPTGTRFNSYLGAFDDGASPLNGYIFEAAIWNRALTPVEVWSLYNPATRWQLRYQLGKIKWFLGAPAAPAAGGLLLRRRRMMIS